MKSFARDVFTAVIIVLIICVVFGAITLVIAYGNEPKDIGKNLTDGWYYALTTCVVEIDRDNDIVTCEDCNGNLWEFYGVEDWEVGDCANLLMNSRGTEKIQDDTIENAKFSAWTLTR